MRISDKVYLDYDDVLLVPQRSSLCSRDAVDLLREYKFRHSPIELKATGVIAANMDTIGTYEMAKALREYNMLTALHKYYSPFSYKEWFSSEESRFTFYTMGLSKDDFDNLILLCDKVGFIPMICIEAANGYTTEFVNIVKKVREYFTESVIMAGNVATPNMVEELILSGADIVKIGIGPGLACKTRVKTGVGVPQLSAIDECSYAAHGLRGHICADGGIRTAGDVCKAFAAGADFVMIGSMFAGTDESACPTLDDGNTAYYGMSSDEFNERRGIIRVGQKTSEGTMIEIPKKGSVKEVAQDIIGGLASCCTYLGCHRIKDMPRAGQFVRVNRVHF